MSCRAIATLVASVVASTALAVDTPESEPNDTKAAANLVTLSPGDSISGVTTGTSTTVAGIASADYFKITTASAPAGIYRYTLTLTTTGTAGHTASIRGLTQTAAGVITAGTDASCQSSFTQPDTSRLLAWYGFGAQEQLYVSVTGAAATTGTYTATLARSTAITPAPLATNLASAGQYTIRVTGTGATTDPELWVYNADTLAPVGDFNNDDTLGGGLQSTLTRDFPVGRYLLALCDYNLQTNLPSPADENGRGENVVDFPNMICDSDRETSFTAAVEIHQGLIGGPIVSTGSFAKTQDFEVMWVSFTVGNPNPTCVADQNGDGGVNIDDLIIYLTAFEAGTIAADLDNDGGVTINDLILFLIHFEAGC